jgi:hypothetical protein
LKGIEKRWHQDNTAAYAQQTGQNPANPPITIKLASTGNRVGISIN